MFYNAKIKYTSVLTRVDIRIHRSTFATVSIDRVHGRGGLRELIETFGSVRVNPSAIKMKNSRNFEECDKPRLNSRQ